MTEEEWISSGDAKWMLHSLRGQASERRLRSFMVACTQPIWAKILATYGKAAFALQAQWAEWPEVVAENGYLQRLMDFLGASPIVESDGVTSAYSVNALDGGWVIALAVLPNQISLIDSNSGRIVGGRIGAGWDMLDRAAQCCDVIRAIDRGVGSAPAAFLRDIFGNPFRPVAFDPRWRTGDAVGLARAIYEDRAFERLPLLADALMDAGCADEQVLGHCRSEGPHVRGCWVVDLVLGKE
jgi:hypothetical protein